MRENWNGVPGQVRPPAAAAAGMPAHLQAVMDQVCSVLIFRVLLHISIQVFVVCELCMFYYNLLERFLVFDLHRGRTNLPNSQGHDG